MHIISITCVIVKYDETKARTSINRKPPAALFLKTLQSKKVSSVHQTGCLELSYPSTNNVRPAASERRKNRTVTASND